MLPAYATLDWGLLLLEPFLMTEEKIEEFFNALKMPLTVKVSIVNKIVAVRVSLV